MRLDGPTGGRCSLEERANDHLSPSSLVCLGRGPLQGRPGGCGRNRKGNEQEMGKR